MFGLIEDIKSILGKVFKYVSIFGLVCISILGIIYLSDLDIIFDNIVNGTMEPY